MTTNDTKRTILFPNTKCRKCANCTYIEKRIYGDCGCRLEKCKFEKITDDRT